MHGSVSAGVGSRRDGAAGDAVLEVTGVSIAFGGLRVLTDVGFTVGRREIVGLIGPNGAGKSTCFNVITSVYRPEAGAVVLQGKPITGLRPDWICRHGVARTFQLVRTFQRMTALQNVMVGAVYGHAQAAGRPDVMALDALALVGLTDRADHTPGELSGGQQQRVAIARALITDPTLIVADEPTGDLDRTTAGEILDLLDRLNRELRKTILMVTHDPKAAERAHRIVHLEKGVLAD